MKTFILILCLSSIAFGADGKKKSHQTATGKYPFYYADVEGQDNSWTEEMQADYDGKMDDTINELCIDTVAVQRAQATLEHEKEVGKMTGLVNKIAVHEAGSVLVNMKPIIAHLAKIVKDGTGKDASTYECP